MNNSHTILQVAFDTASSFLALFEETEKNTKIKDKEQDLLRAMLIFACAGLDSMLKQLVRDALGQVIDRKEGADIQLKRYIERRFSRQGTLDLKFLSEVLTRTSPRDALIEELVNELSSKSLQSKDQILRTASYFDIESSKIASISKDIDAIFQCRNQIAHELDVDLEQENRYRRPRQKETMIEYTKGVLELANKILLEVDNALLQN